VKAYVLDTHVLVWFLCGRTMGKSASRALDAVDAGRATGWIPAVVTIELALLHERGRVSIGIAELEATLARNPLLRILPLDLAQAREFALLRGVRDPFDRMILAAAKSAACPLISADERVAASGLVDVLWD
jgi:PIN domain nuclease of toxin-antitoxin system